MVISSTRNTADDAILFVYLIAVSGDISVSYLFYNAIFGRHQPLDVICWTSMLFTSTLEPFQTVPLSGYITI